jgi:ATP-dependent Clp protease adaptor protein ClpS
MEVIQKAGLTQMTETVQTVPDTITEIEVGEKERTAFVPQYHVVLLDDDDHSYDYVIEMLMALFGHSQETAYKMAVEVDTKGRVIVETTHKERAELKRDQIQSYGPDWRIPHCKGSMSARIEPAEEAL